MQSDVLNLSHYNINVFIHVAKYMSINGAQKIVQVN